MVGGGGTVMAAQKLVPSRPLRLLGKTWRAGEGGGEGVEGGTGSRGGGRPWRRGEGQEELGAAGKSLRVLGRGANTTVRTKSSKKTLLLREIET